MKKVFLLILPAFLFLFSSANALEEIMPISIEIQARDAKACTMDYNPVCGVDGVTYGNACSADKVKIAYKGECKIKACTREYMPVCGSVKVQCIKAPCNPVFETFSNKCELGNNQLAKKAYDGECKDKISTADQLKYYKNIKRYGNTLFGDKLEKISGPSQIKNYTNIKRIGKDLYGDRKPQVMAKIDINGAYNSLLALNSECSTNGQTIIMESVYNENVDKSEMTDTVITFAGTTTRENCEFSCTYYLGSQKVVPNYNCK